MTATAQSLTRSQPAATVAASPRRWPGIAVLMAAAVAFALCLAAIVNLRVPLSHSAAWWQFARLAGLLGFWLACVAAASGVALLLVAVRHGETRWPGLLATGLGVAALAVVAWGVWQTRLPAYWLQDPREPTTAQLDSLGPAAVVRAYLTSQDLSVQYRLSDTAQQAAMNDPDTVQDLSLLAGVDRLRVSALPTKAADRRSYSVTYVSRTPDAAGAKPGEQSVTVDLAREPGGPWRVSYWGFPL